ncbi:DUF3592 domain-containing protein [Parashewanella spongiae]|uniref:DUF3592 domain-containing protein n=1 Tax=Parashewanella spongiae TaxID=342950 RepID=A0A3A6U876_9GAMM|nr:DUF3592 domain-containing protein [Parashewanella spongiae]MCL1077088.1 DUF3592 domain-containing protein [Parashewanella spongiae]RJY17676.1 DUF3592 domain-containing protein [Parashewanella spongiae]
MDLIETYNNTPLFILIVLVSLIFVTIYYSIFSIGRAVRTFFFPSVMGKIIESDVVSKVSDLNTEPNARKQVYQTEILYKYNVDGKAYTSNKLSWHELKSTIHSIHESELSDFEEGKLVKVYYNPKKPSVAVLKRGLVFASFFNLLFLFLSIATVFFIIFKKYLVV